MTQATGVAHSYRFTGREGGALPAGRYRVRVRARDGAGNALVRSAGTSAVDEIGVFPYRFPLKGNFPYGDPGSRFGAPRSGHKHQGQDIGAPEGTQIRAARGGIVKTVAYQAGGAGNYIVIDGAGQQNRDYVYMHLQTDSTRVREGQRVATGAVDRERGQHRRLVRRPPPLRDLAGRVVGRRRADRPVPVAAPLGPLVLAPAPEPTRSSARAGRSGRRSTRWPT